MARNKMQTEYIHGYSRKEQARLNRQARILAPFTHRHIDLGDAERVLEIGCGTGGQICVLAESFPNVSFSGIDISPATIAAARDVCNKQLPNRTIELAVAPASQLPFDDGVFDIVVVFFLLEHTPDPISILREARRVLRVGKGICICTEVINSKIVCVPESKVILKYIEQLNRLQRELGGEPDAGMFLEGWFKEAGFSRANHFDASVSFRSDTTQCQRLDLVENWIAVFLSVADKLLDRQWIDRDMVDRIPDAFQLLLENPMSRFVYAATQVKAHV